MQWLRSLFGFTRSQTNGFAVLLILLLLVIFSEPLYRNFLLPPDQPPEIIVPETQARVAPLPDSLHGSPKKISAIKPHNLNPNYAAYDDWLSLGVPHKIAARILAYRKKGGKFLYKSDLLRIYGFDSALYNRVAVHLDLPDKPKHLSSVIATGKEPKVKLDLNFADSVQLVMVYGIGPVLARRIVKYREALGGFVAWQQLYSVYGLDTPTIATLQNRFYIDGNFAPRKININHATEQELAAHPLISRFMARAIVNYRWQHGHYSTVDDIRKIIAIAEKDFESVKPYLSVE